jgi:predicted MFS family arabinose efflux permease
VSGWAFFPAQQVRVIGVVGVTHAPVALALNASFMYVSFSFGAVLGSIVITSLSIEWIGAAGAVCVVIAAVMSMIAWQRNQPRRD